MVNNYPEYAAGISYQKAESNAKHFYNAQVKIDPSDDSMSAVLTKDGEVISELPGEGGGVTVEALNVTENGTYSEEGKAYSPVVVNVAGGSSDFSTAEVSITAFNGIEIHIPYIDEDSTDFGIWTVYQPADSDSHVLQTVLYKGLAYISAPNGNVTGVTGNAEIDEEEGGAYIRGNCTITFSSI